MIDRKTLLSDLQNVVKALEKDLLARSEDPTVPEVGERLRADYAAAQDAGRTAHSYEIWRTGEITQVASGWVLACVFARFLEDNGFTDPPRLSGSGERLRRARDEHESYFRSHPNGTDRDYLLAVFDELAAIPAAGEVFGPHNTIRQLPNWLGPDAAGELLGFFQRIDSETGALRHDFTSATPAPSGGRRSVGAMNDGHDGACPSGVAADHGHPSGGDTRFLGDLYQDLSEHAKKTYALLQTPEFVEEFILDRTLDPAVEEFGLEDFKLIDPACGSGHFLLGAFQRLLEQWQRKEPGTNVRELVQRALNSIHGVDVNPYAVAIARFRLLLAALEACGITRLQDAPAFTIKLACGDSLIHGTSIAAGLGGMGDWSPLEHVYRAEDGDLLGRILCPGQYHAVVANPPYITVKDKALNDAYRQRYSACHRQYSLSVPFLQRIYDLACDGGFTGQITANSFMKREFGKKLIEEFFPRVDLTHVIDTSGAYIPGHGTPTVILLGRHRRPVVETVRAVMGIKGEPSTPDDPALAKVWSAICAQIDQPGSESEFVSADDVTRDGFHSHPWSIGGGGAAELKELLEVGAANTLGALIAEIGRTTHTGEDGVYYVAPRVPERLGLGAFHVPLVTGETVRDYTISWDIQTLFPYDQADAEPLSPLPQPLADFLWGFRRTLRERRDFGQFIEERGLRWYEHSMFFPNRFRTPLSIAFAFVATHNHFVLDRGGKVFKQSAPIIKLPPDATEDDHLGLLGLLNSSVGCFWMQQAMHNKGGPGGACSKDEKWHDFFEFAGTQLQGFPLPNSPDSTLARSIDECARHMTEVSPDRCIGSIEVNTKSLGKLREDLGATRHRMIGLQEELDWACYAAYGLTDGPITVDGDPPPIQRGERAFEIVMARKMARGELETKWFSWLEIGPTTEIPDHWPDEYQKIVARRIDEIEANRAVRLIEDPKTKRRWEFEPWESQLERALQQWLLDRLESYFDFDGRMASGHDGVGPSAGQLEGAAPSAPGTNGGHDGACPSRCCTDIALLTVARLADIAREDAEFMSVAELYRDDPAFDVQALVKELVAAEAVPLLPAIRYKAPGLRKRAEWETTWALQRLEDAIEADLRQKLTQDGVAPEYDTMITHADLPVDLVVSLPAEAGGARSVVPGLRTASPGADRAAPSEPAEPGGARSVVPGLQTATPGADRAAPSEPVRVNALFNQLQAPFNTVVRAACTKLLGDIPVPPKYKSSDFQKTTYWKLRGKLDVPKERWVSFPHCEGEDGTLTIAWAGYDHLQLAKAVAAWYVDIQERVGGHDDPRLVPLLGGLIELLPWLKQWHNEVDPEYGVAMGEFYAGFIHEEARALGKTVDEIRAWEPPAAAKRGRRKKKG